MWGILREVGIDRSTEIVTWNVVPWYIGNSAGIRAATRTDITEAKEALTELLSLLPAARVAVLLGKAAGSAWDALDPPLPAIRAPHTSPQNLNTRPKSRALIVAALREARRLVGSSDQTPRA